MIGNTELLVAYGHHQLNPVRTIQQAWDRLNATPYATDKASSYSMLRQLMLEINKKEVKSCQKEEI